MKRVLSTMLLAGIATVAVATGAHAAGNENAKIMLHALNPTTKTVCARAANLPVDCTGYQLGVDNKALYPAFHFVYVLVVNGSLTEGVAGVQFGIAYDGPGAADGMGVDIYGWTLCATLEFQTPAPVWPNSGGGNLITWNATGPQCLTPPGNAGIGATGVAGYFYMGAYTPSLMRITPRPIDSTAKIANCGSQEDIVSTGTDDSNTFLGAVGFGRPGINPCGREGVVAVAPSTWSNVKNLIKS